MDTPTFCPTPKRSAHRVTVAQLHPISFAADDALWSVSVFFAVIIPPA
jgi:hypothetical protein